MNAKLKKQEGFTIIEVLIVLAIAGLIVLIVFLAVPALQRNSRNTQRKTDASQMAGALSEAINNSNGTLAAGVTAPPQVTQVRTTQLITIDYRWASSGVAATIPATINPDTILIRNNLRCNGTYADPGTNVTTIATTIGTGAANIATADGATARTAVLIYGIERQGGFTGQCQNL